MNAPFSVQAGGLSGVTILQPRAFSDARGDFVKTYHDAAWQDAGLDLVMREEYYSTSYRGVVRGMHFQRPPQDHVKVVYCLAGRVRDVLLDLRTGSPTYGRWMQQDLSPENRLILVIPRGIAHGFLALEDRSVMIYKTSTPHSPEHDAGVRWDSFGFDWGWPDPIISARDAALPPFARLLSPFP